MTQRFRISYRDGSYRVSIPNYEGGEVVRAEHYDKEIGRLRQTLRTISGLYGATRQEPSALNASLASASMLAREAIED